MAKSWARRTARPDLEPSPAPPNPSRPMMVGAADDPAEREADLVAARVVDDLAQRPLQGPASTGRLLRTSTPRMDAPAHDVDRQAQTRIRRMGTGPVGPEGGAIDADVQARLDRSRGGGSPLGDDVRRPMEQAFGDADFGGVRVHTGSESDELNTRLGAQAFTVGSDIYLGAGTPSMASGDGRHLLAHELTHTLQQGAGARRRVIRRLAWNKPLKGVTAITVFGDGGSGLAAQVTDGSKPVIVKSNQVNATEVLVADKMLHQGKFKSGGSKVKVPRSRLAAPGDVAELKAKAPLVIPAGQGRDFVKGLDGSYPTLVAEAMSGTNLGAILDSALKRDDDAATKTSTWTSDTETVASVKRLLTDTSPIKALAKASGVDVVMGNGDRALSAFGKHNVKFDPKTKKWSFIDNTSKNVSGALTDRVKLETATSTKPARVAMDNARANFEEWCKLAYVPELSGDLDALASRIIKVFVGVDGSGVYDGGGIASHFRELGPTKNAKVGNDVRTAVRDEILNLIQAQRPTLLAAVRAGLVSGRATVLKSLANPLTLTKGVPPRARLDAVTSLIARRTVLQGNPDPKAAWTAANREARKLLKLEFKDAEPANSSKSAPQSWDARGAS